MGAGDEAARSRLRDEAGSELCTACGLCCDGSLYLHAPLEPDEIEHARRLGLALLADAPDPRFAQPCTCFVGGRCGVYPERPSSCVRYECHLLARVRAREISAADGAAQVDAAKRLIASIRARLPPEHLTGSVWAGVKSFERASAAGADDVGWRRDHAELLMDAIELRTLCQRVFDSRVGAATRVDPR